MSNRLTRDEIKRDEVRDRLVEVMVWLQENLKTILMSLLVVLGLSVAFVGWQALVRAKEDKASVALSEALKLVEDSDSGELSVASEALATVKENYGSTDAGAIASVYLGRIAAGNGDNGTARAEWEAFLTTQQGNALAASVERNLISLDLAEGNFEALESRLRDQLAAGSSALGEDSLLFELGRVLESQDKGTAALEIYSRLLDEHPTSLYLTQARQLSEALKGGS